MVWRMPVSQWRPRCRRRCISALGMYPLSPTTCPVGQRSWAPMVGGIHIAPCNLDGHDLALVIDNVDPGFPATKAMEQEVKGQQEPRPQGHKPAGAGKPSKQWRNSCSTP